MTFMGSRHFTFVAPSSIKKKYVYIYIYIYIYIYTHTHTHIYIYHTSVKININKLDSLLHVFIKIWFFSDLKSNENHFHISLRSLSLPVRWAPCPLTSQWLLRLDFVLKFNHAISGSPGVCDNQVCLFPPCPQPFWCHGGGGGHAPAPVTLCLNPPLPTTHFILHGEEK